jgi:hypothetical protein
MIVVLLDEVKRYTGKPALANGVKPNKNNRFYKKLG